jgi:hypothetical protein
MKQVSDMVRKFLEEYERGIDVSDYQIIAASYNDEFIFSSQLGVQVIKKDDFLKVLPKREEFFETLGLASSRIQSLEEARLDDKYG